MLESDLVANRSDFALMLASTAYTMEFIIAGGGTDATITIPGMQRVGIAPGDTNGIRSRTIEFLHTGSSAATIELTATP